jgi:hypothetical protein
MAGKSMLGRTERPAGDRLSSHTVQPIQTTMSLGAADHPNLRPNHTPIVAVLNNPSILWSDLRPWC